VIIEISERNCEKRKRSFEIVKLSFEIAKRRRKKPKSLAEMASGNVEKPSGIPEITCSGTKPSLAKPLAETLSLPESAPS